MCAVVFRLRDQTKQTLRISGLATKSIKLCSKSVSNKKEIHETCQNLAI